tara:strand:+ start:2746 stop:2967 length:222 start_codon:yes stop_codon:yes gene_type:complete
MERKASPFQQEISYSKHWLMRDYFSPQHAEEEGVALNADALSLREGALSFQQKKVTSHEGKLGRGGACHARRR